MRQGQDWLQKRLRRLFWLIPNERINDVPENFYPGRHDILHEASQDHVIEDIVEWLDGLYWQEYL